MPRKFFRKFLPSHAAIRGNRHVGRFGALLKRLSLAVSAANVSIQHRLPMADSIMYATAMAYDATLWTLDVDFAHLPDVQYRKR